MTKLFRCLAFAAALGLLASCGWGKKSKPTSSTHIYSGDTAPSIRYSDKPEAAGGPLNSY